MTVKLCVCRACDLHISQLLRDTAVDNLLRTNLHSRKAACQKACQKAPCTHQVAPAQARLSSHYLAGLECSLALTASSCLSPCDGMKMCSNDPCLHGLCCNLHVAALNSMSEHEHPATKLANDLPAGLTAMHLQLHAQPLWHACTTETQRMQLQMLMKQMHLATSLTRSLYMALAGIYHSCQSLRVILSFLVMCLPGPFSQMPLPQASCRTTC